LSDDGKHKTEKLTLERKLEVLKNGETAQGIRHQAEQLAYYATTLDGLNQSIADLKNGDPGAVLSVVDRVQKDIAKEKKSLLEENIELETRYATIGEDSATRYRNAWLKAITDIKQANEDAKLSIISSQVKIADQTVFNADRAKAGILESMAGAKGYTEIFTDGFLQLTGAISDGMGSLFDKVNSKLGAFGHVLTSIETNLLTMVTNRLMMKVLDMLLGTGGGTGQQVAGGSGSGMSVRYFSSVLGGGGNGGSGLG
jgi:hypothetical protein